MTAPTRIEGPLRFPVPIHCARAVLGTEQPIALAGYSGVVATPALPPDAETNYECHLERPSGAHQGIPGYYSHTGPLERKHDWGEPLQWPSLHSMVKAVELWFSLPDAAADASSAASIAESIREAIPEWTERLATGLEVLTRQMLDPASFARLTSHDTKLYLVSPASPPQSLRPRVIRLTAVAPDDEKVIHLDSWAAAVRFASEGRMPKLEHVLLRDARHALKHGAYRRAVIDAGTAVELAVSEESTVRLTGALGAQAAEAILRRFPALGNRLALGSILPLPLGSRDLKRELVEPRNRATHQGSTPSRAEARQALQAATEVVDALVPDRFTA